MNSAVEPLAWDEDSRFRISSPSEIISELRGAMEQGALLTIGYGANRECALSKLLEVDAQKKLLIVDACQDSRDLKKVLAADALTLETEVRRIRIRFASAPAVSTTFEGQPALQIPMPKSILRIQRREAYRIETPVNDVVNCRFPHPALNNREIILRVADLSVKGMGITADPGLWPAEQGTVIKDCRIDLPGIGVVYCDSLIVRVFETPNTGKHRLWIGCQFLQLPGPAGTLLQRYILELERARLSRSRGMKIH